MISILKDIMNRDDYSAHSRQGQRSDYRTIHPSGTHRRGPVAPSPASSTPPRTAPVQQRAPVREQVDVSQKPKPVVPEHKPIAAQQPHHASQNRPVTTKRGGVQAKPRKMTDVAGVHQSKKTMQGEAQTSTSAGPFRDVAMRTTPDAHYPDGRKTTVASPIKPDRYAQKTPPPRALSRHITTLAQWHPRLQHSVIWITALSVLVLGGAGTAIWAVTQSGGVGNVLPVAVVEPATYTVFAPITGIVPDSADYDAVRSMVSYRMTSPAAVTVSMQAMPAQFTDVPGYADRFFNGLEPYKTFTSDIGKVHLTWRADNENADTAIINAGDTLIFVSSPKELPLDTWKNVVTTLQAI